MLIKNNRYAIGENDEGPHHKKNYSTREWWYYNCYFNHPDSELKNWSFCVSYSKFSRFRYTTLKLLIHGDKKIYGDLYSKSSESIILKPSGVDIKFLDSFAKGRYPRWHIYAENSGMDKNKITVDLLYKAKSRPIWILKNTGRNLSDSYYGYYCIMKCDSEGIVTIDDKSYFVKGIGYHDHTWSNFSKRDSKQRQRKKMTNYFKRQNLWSWLVIHLENGWDIFIGKTYLNNKSFFSKYALGTTCILPDNKNLFESFFFPMDYKEFKIASVSSIKIPTKLRVKLIKINPLKTFIGNGPVFLDMCYKSDNMKEMIVGDPPSWGQWDSTGEVRCLIKTLKGKEMVNGWAMMEHTNFLS